MGIFFPFSLAKQLISDTIVDRLYTVLLQSDPERQIAAPSEWPRDPVPVCGPIHRELIKALFSFFPFPPSVGTRPKESPLGAARLSAPSPRPTLQISSAPPRQQNQVRLQSNINQPLFYKGGGSSRQLNPPPHRPPAPRPRPALPPHVNAPAITHL